MFTLTGGLPSAPTREQKIPTAPVGADVLGSPTT